MEYVAALVAILLIAACAFLLVRGGHRYPHDITSPRPEDGVEGGHTPTRANGRAKQDGPGGSS